MITVGEIVRHPFTWTGFFLGLCVAGTLAVWSARTTTGSPTSFEERWWPRQCDVRVSDVTLNTSRDGRVRVTLLGPTDAGTIVTCILGNPEWYTVSPSVSGNGQ